MKQNVELVDMDQQEQNNMRLYGITTQDIDGQEFIKVVSSNYKALSKSGENIWYTDAKIIDVYNLEYQDMRIQMLGISIVVL